MVRSPDRDLAARQNGFAFFGAITASLSHELNNVLATIKELSGLLEDLVHAVKPERPLNGERVISSLEKMNVQVERGRRYVKQLNRFAHSADEPEAAIDLCDTVAEIVALSQRLAKLNRVDLITELPEQMVKIDGSSFEAQHVLYRCLKAVMTAAGQGEKVVVRLSDDGPRIVVEVAGPDRAIDVSPEWLHVTERLAEEVGAVFVSEGGDSGKMLLHWEPGRAVIGEVRL
ncbi:MAG: hypothetical protein A2289_00710 [Deltaproteobacteria bacterium RIFOXYA12_FULL_58_15]|nr:MAG: hypothetical protein A2289_00710 [Deltaproteobacteria bacterium RIFOXYA12_FULL_58_15]OGR08528.1 MAG: hypothetical protein A2341_25275 [Deltaproteobacteria bacterium RIFOXYB12_FULL_58_9]